MSARARTITIKIPTMDMRGWLLALTNSLGSNLSSPKPKLSLPRFSISNPLKRFNWGKVIPVTIVLVAAGLTVAVVITLLGRVNNPPAAPRVSVAAAKATSALNREFVFPLKDSAGKTATEMKFTLETAELRDEIIVKGKRAVAIEGRTFLILTFKITSGFTKSLEINTKNYFRLVRNGNETDLLAADIHNDPVVVQPTSTKYTRLGWPINDTDTSMVLLVGEIEGEKTKVELGLP